MRTPYRADEIAAAVLDAAARAGLRIQRLEIVPDEVRRVWIIRASASGGDERRLMVPFATPRGIYTPAEIAEHLARGDWPFG